MPLELILPVHPNMTKTDWQQRHTLQAMLLTIKKHFIQEKPVRAIVEQMSTHLEHVSCPPLSVLKDLGTFCDTKHNVHRFTLNLHRLKIMIVESVP